MRSHFEDEVFEAFILGKTKPGKCLRCEVDAEHIFMTPSQTMYVNSENEPLPLCFFCSQEYTEMMEDQWREYYSGLL